MEEWTPPTGYVVESNKELAELTADERIESVIDPINEIADELFEAEHPDCLDDTKRQQQFKQELLAQGAAYGRWFYYPWRRNLIRYPEPDDHYNLRTFRNRNLITKEEQRQKLRPRKLACVGLSVGSNIVDEAVQAGIGDNYLLFDFDRLSPTNLNRIRATMGQVGLYKTTVAGRKISEVDPYIDQSHFTNGYDETTDDVLRAERPDVIIEEVDNLEAKAHLRRIAAELQIPLIMVGDAGDKVPIDIERHDQGRVKPFNGALSDQTFAALLRGPLPKKETESALMKLIGLRNLSPRLIDSGVSRGIETGGFPQLGSTAALGGVLASVAIREILLDRPLKSDIHVGDTRKIIGAGPETTWRENIQIAKKFIKYRKEGER